MAHLLPMTGIYVLYTGRLRRQVLAGRLPEHVGLIMDGNRRWARQAGMANPSLGHRAGAEHAEQVLSWCEAVGIKNVTVFICSTENLRHRDDAEVAYLMQVIEDVVAARLARRDARWQVHVAGMLDALPDSTARALKNAVEVTRDCSTGAHVTLAIGYGGRQEIIDAVRDLLTEADAAGVSMADLAANLTADDITAHLYTAGRPDPDLVIRTSGEQRLSNFLLWQSAYSELYFCEAYWPAFREIDFLRALRSYAARNLREGASQPPGHCHRCVPHQVKYGQTTCHYPQQALWPARLVGMPGFEPGASCSQSRRANQAAPHPAKPTVAYLSSRIPGRWTARRPRSCPAHSGSDRRRAARSGPIRWTG